MVVEVDPRISYIFPTHYLPNMIDLERISSLDHPELRHLKLVRPGVRIDVDHVAVLVALDRHVAVGR